MWFVYLEKILFLVQLWAHYPGVRCVRREVWCCYTFCRCWPTKFIKPDAQSTVIWWRWDNHRSLCPGQPKWKFFLIKGELVFFFFNFFYWSSIFQHIAYNPVLIPSSAPLGAHHTVTPSPCPRPLPLPLVCFPELRVSHVLLPSLLFPTHFLSLPLHPFHYFLFSPNEWDHICLSFSEWLISVSIIPSSSIPVEANSGYLWFLMTE